MREARPPRFIFVRRVLSALVGFVFFGIVNLTAHILLDSDIADDILFSKYLIEIIDKESTSVTQPKRDHRSTLTPYSKQTTTPVSSAVKKVTLANLRRYGWVSGLMLSGLLFAGVVWYRLLNGSPGMRCMRLRYMGVESDRISWRKAFILSGTDVLLVLGMSAHWLVLLLFGARFHHFWYFLTYFTIGFWLLAMVRSRPVSGVLGSQSQYDRVLGLTMVNSFA